jgi:hypothetical protein
VTTQPGTSATTDQLLQQMNDRLDAQAKEIAALQAKLAAQAQATPQPPPAPAAPSSTAPASTTPGVEEQLADQNKKMADLQRAINDINNDRDSGPTYPNLQFHGFGDIDYHADTLKGDTNSVTLGEFDFFLSSQLSPDLNVLSESVVAADTTNHDSIEIERLLLQWDPSDYFNVDIGRYHTEVGYYNTAYHHGTWFQTAVNRPFIDEFEDSGGIIPAHSVGISFHGNIPGDFASKLGLGYFAEFGNGHQYQSPTSPNSPVANVIDDNNYKAFNFAVISRPVAIPGLQFGFGVYGDTLTPTGIPRTQETILDGHLVYKNADWEFLSEAYAINHSSQGENAWSPAFFAQLGRKIGDFTPYARFAYFNAAGSDPIYQLTQDTGLHYGPSVGVRWDFATFAALKLQYDYFVNSQEGVALTLPFQQIHSGSYSEIECQVSFTY